MTTFNWLIVFVFISHFIKTLLNWDIYNQLNPKNKAKISINYPGKGFTKKGHESIVDDNLFFMYCCFVFFWIKIPKNSIGRGMAWSVLIISILQISALLIALNYFTPKPSFNMNQLTEYEIEAKMIDQPEYKLKKISWDEAKGEKINDNQYLVKAFNDSLIFIVTVDRLDSSFHSFTLDKEDIYYQLIDSCKYYGVNKELTLAISRLTDFEINIINKNIKIESSLVEIIHPHSMDLDSISARMKIIELKKK